ncbi:sn-1,2-diacylglycerol cholinephosphotransferase [Thamnocephalis sphaerospora]|uniref:sn-1,2-diacylglycerol cholinephosphotransferase n=1 Tax=Thamnocephalis sphaerospora TaxID=78915 RepID=A0A4P9XKK5_9FUNG|nr:sn-1,2-diacylglycerol cholinephosphotransferase [Thamnocephalis sphaerospora]|eukprot:RKP05961.1 sn-1,2-diacylglycerol cholinephosphotransferase [Thamnocephalis sphaerospora]
MFTAGQSYVSKEALENLKYYKYASIDKSYVTKYVLRHYWEWATTLFPRWMAPNLITLCGLGFVVANLAMIAIWIPDLYGPAPSWMYFSFAAGIWLYSTFDNVDGKQARRTGTSSPLGELFDHGVDALNCSLGALLQAAGMGLGQSWYTVFIVALTTTPFYFSTWEEYHTGVLYLGYVNGPTEGLIISCVALCISGVYGPDVWFQLFHETFAGILPSSLLNLVPADMALIDLLVSSMLFLLVFTQLPACLYGVNVACKRKGTSFAGAIAQLLPMAIYLVATISWILSPYSSLLANNHLILFTVTVGLVFGRVATKIILAHLTRMPFPWFTVMMIPLVAGSLMVNAPYLFGATVLTADTELYYLCAFTVFATVAYGHWALLVIDRFCTHLGIRCLTIPHGKTAAAAKNGKSQ